MTALNLSEKTTAQLIEMYNDKAFMLDRPTVKRFADRATAEKRVAQIYVANASKTTATETFVEAPKPAKEPKKAKEPAKTRAPKEDGAVVREGSFRDKLLEILQKNEGKQVPISKLMEAVYGESRKDFKGPLMMVMKGLRGVVAANKLGTIEKTRENKENYFGLHKKANG
jgi:hypothetical protein